MRLYVTLKELAAIFELGDREGERAAALKERTGVFAKHPRT